MAGSDRSVWDRLGVRKISGWLRRDGEVNELPPPPEILRGLRTRPLPRRGDEHLVPSYLDPSGSLPNQKYFQDRNRLYDTDDSHIPTSAKRAATRIAQSQRDLARNHTVNNAEVVSGRSIYHSADEKPSRRRDSTAPNGKDNARPTRSRSHPVEAKASFFSNEATSTISLTVRAHDYGWSKQHRVFSIDDEEPMAIVRHLGHGSLGVVEEVRQLNTTLPPLVRKRVKLPAQKRLAEQRSKIIRDEISTLRRLSHPNIVTLIGSYEDRRHIRHASYCILMLPVGDGDLENFLAIASEPDLASALKIQYKTWIQSWYVDLASALAYMHSSGVRHQDIKPSNIIHKGHHIFFTDFSSCGRFKVDQTTSTSNQARFTAMYAAPEADDSLNGRYGRAFDVFGLGCVFCDMLTVEHDRSVSAFHDFLRSRNRGPRLRYSEHVPSIQSWFADQDIAAADCLFGMLLEDRHTRPSAARVLERYATDLQPKSQDSITASATSSGLLSVPILDHHSMDRPRLPPILKKSNEPKVGPTSGQLLKDEPVIMASNNSSRGNHEKLVESAERVMNHDISRFPTHPAHGITLVREKRWLSLRKAT